METSGKFCKKWKDLTQNIMKMKELRGIIVYISEIIDWGSYSPNSNRWSLIRRDDRKTGPTS